MPAKIIQISVATMSPSITRLYALDDKGRVWRCQDTSDSQDEWRPRPTP